MPPWVHPVNSRNSKDHKTTTPVASVIIPTYDSAAYIRQCLAAILNQKTELPFEIIVIDSSTDGTDGIVAEEFPEVRLFHFPKRCYTGAARNIGVEKACGRIVLFLDSDCIAGKTWIEQLYAAIDGTTADGVCGSVENGTPWSITGSVGFYLEFFRFVAYDGKPRKSLFLLGGNSAFKKEVFRNSQYTDANIGDDFTFSWQLAKQGKVLLFLPSASVRHLNKTGLKKVLHYQYKLGIGACSYRHYASQGIMRVFGKLPGLIFLMPFGVMVWVAQTILRRRRILEFFKFIVTLPLSYIANNAWALGFYHGLRNQRIRANNQVMVTDG